MLSKEQFDAFCKSLSDGMHWGDPITPHVLQQIVEALRAQADAQPFSDDEHTLMSAVEHLRDVDRKPDASFRIASKLDEMRKRLADAQPIYQWQCNLDGSWRDVDEAEYKLIGTKYRRIVYIHPAPEAAQALSDAKARIAELEAAVKDWKSKAEYRALNDALTRSAATVVEPSETDRAVRCLSREPSENVKAVYATWADENGRRAKTLADRIIDDYLLHYDFPTQGQSHMQDCIVSVLSAALTEAPQAAHQQAEPVGDFTGEYAYHNARGLYETQYAGMQVGWTLFGDLHKYEQAYWIAKAALVAQSGQRAGVAIPEGWQLVPKTPTREMCQAAAGMYAIHATDDLHLHKAGWSMHAIMNGKRWADMLAAAPTPAAQGGDNHD